MSKHLRIPMTQFRFWIVKIYYLSLLMYTNEVDGYDFIDMQGYYKFITVIKGGFGICTGTIVSRDWVLTAAHCVYDDVEAGKDVTVMAGVTNYQYPQEDTGQFRSSVEIKPHPKFWNHRLAKFDIALIKVNDSFRFNEWVDKIDIAEDGWTASDEVADNCMSLGFGSYFGDKSPIKYLKTWNVTAEYGPESCPCTRRYQWKRLVCSKSPDYAKLCRGDDGGPLVCGNVVRAVAHMIRNWYVCSEDPRYPLDNCVGSPARGMSVYTLLCPFNDWLHSVVEEIPPTPATCGAAAPTYFTTVLVFCLFCVYLRRQTCE